MTMRTVSSIAIADGAGQPRWSDVKLLHEPRILLNILEP